MFTAQGPEVLCFMTKVLHAIEVAVVQSAQVRLVYLNPGMFSSGGVKFKTDEHSLAYCYSSGVFLYL